jgi:hypothetical protein
LKASAGGCDACGGRSSPLIGTASARGSYWAEDVAQAVGVTRDWRAFEGKAQTIALRWVSDLTRDEQARLGLARQLPRARGEAVGSAPSGRAHPRAPPVTGQRNFLAVDPITRSCRPTTPKPRSHTPSKRRCRPRALHERRGPFERRRSVTGARGHSAPTSMAPSSSSCSTESTTSSMRLSSMSSWVAASCGTRTIAPSRARKK